MNDDWPETALQAFAVADWNALMPKLSLAAQGCLRGLGWAEGEDTRPFALEARELVNEAIESLLGGRRTWVRGTGGTERSLLGILCETMRSIAVNRYLSADVRRRGGGVDAIEEKIDSSPSPSRQVAARMHLTRIEEALAGDDDALAVYRALETNHTERHEIVEALGWTVERVNAARKRMQRRLASRGIHPDEDGEREQPGSSP